MKLVFEVLLRLCSDRQNPTSLPLRELDAFTGVYSELPVGSAYYPSIS